MPIKGLTEYHRLPRIGKIHLGIKKKNAKGVEYPSPTDYFVCPPEVQEVYGKEPKFLDIIFPVEDDEMWCNQYYRQYSRTRGLICKGDGETCQRMVDEETGDKANKSSKAIIWKRGLPCQGKACPDYQSKFCQEVMNLQFMLLKVPGLGIWQIDTGSINSIRNINDFATMLRATCQQVRWVPLKLTLEPTTVNNPDDGKTKTVHCLKLSFEGGLPELLQIAGKPKQELLIAPPAEDEPPLDVTERQAVKADSKKAKEDIDGLWPQDKPKAEPDPSLKTAQGAVESISSPLKAVTGSEQPAEEFSNGIIWPDLAKMLEELRITDPEKFTDTYISSELANRYKVKGDTVKEQCQALSPTDAKRFTGSVQGALLKAKAKKESPKEIREGLDK